MLLERMLAVGGCFAFGFWVLGLFCFFSVRWWGQRFVHSFLGNVATRIFVDSVWVVACWLRQLVLTETSRRLQSARGAVGVKIN
jgi:hypothetical protein